MVNMKFLLELLRAFQLPLSSLTHALSLFSVLISYLMEGARRITSKSHYYQRVHNDTRYMDSRINALFDQEI